MKSRLLAVGLVVLAVFAVCGCKPRELSGEQARELVRDIRKARAEVSLQGELTTGVQIGDRYVNGEATIHRGDGRLQLEFTDGKAKGVRIIEQGGGVWQIGPDGKTVRRLPRNPLDEMPPLGKKAVVTVARGVRVAGRPTDNVVIRPHPDSEARVEIWADKATRLPLASARYNHAGELIASTQYTAVDFSAPAPKRVKLPQAPTGQARLQQAEKIDKAKATQMLGQEPLEPTYVPEGFELQGYYAHQRQRGQGVEVRYSDGVRLLNIIEIKLPGRAEMREAWEERQRETPDRGEAGAERRRAGQQQGEGQREHWQQRREAQGQSTEPGRGHRQGRAERGPRPDGAERGQRPDGAERGAWQRGPGGGEPGLQQPSGRQQRGEWGGGMMRSRLRGKIIRFRVENLGIIVAGEVPAEELRKVADSMRETSTDF